MSGQTGKIFNYYFFFCEFYYFRRNILEPTFYIEDRRANSIKHLLGIEENCHSAFTAVQVIAHSVDEIQKLSDGEAAVLKGELFVTDFTC